MTFNREEYLAKHGLICPYCSSDDINTVVDHAITTVDTFRDEIECNECHRTWYDVLEYKLVDVEEIPEGV